LHTARVAVIGAGVAGLASAIDLANAGFEVTLFERAAAPGGKIREIPIDGLGVDAGPTVFTLRRVFDEIFADADDDLDRRIKLTRAALLARHAWNGNGYLDLHADLPRNVQSIGEFAGAREAEGFVRFAAEARRIYRTLDETFMRAPRPSPFELARRVGVLADLWNIRPFTSLWSALGRYFRDPRLRQLFARYATYCGSSPFRSPATLMLVAHVEQEGVWYVEGGMHRLALELAHLAERKGAALRCSTGIAEIVVERARVQAVRTEQGEHIPVDAVVCNADASALAAGLFGAGAARAVRGTPTSKRSLSAVTLALRARTSGFELAHHSVFFGTDYRNEFEDIFRRGRLPSSPTIYACAQDRRDASGPVRRAERLLLLVNAPANGDFPEIDDTELDSCEERIFRSLALFGLRIERQPNAVIRTGPQGFQRLFPATGGALYGPASHGWMASFTRAGSRTTIRGLYLAGGSSHPGPGLPMAAISGRLAAAALLSDLGSTASCRTAAMHGGMSTHSATMETTGSR
jgi:1-hydroxycarotenoid 3,4-desaturase